MRGVMKRRFRMVACSMLFGVSVVALSAGTGSAASTLCVQPDKPGCYATIQAALAAASSGDTIEVAPGTYAGPVTIAKTIQLIGAGAAATIIQGGGPVVTIGDLTGATAPTVSIRGVTITGGVIAGTVVGGGGVLISGPDSGNKTAATVSITDSVITGNRASVLTVVPPGAPCGPPPGKRCSYASGGGIDNARFLTLANTRVTDNVAENTATNAPSIFGTAHGGGISNHPHATLTLSNCVVSGNQAVASGTVAESASGGGILDDGALTVANSEVSANSAELSTSLPGSIFAGNEPEAEAGGIEITDSASVTIANSTVNDNTTTAGNTGGDVNADTGGIDSDGSLTLSNSTVENNQARASVPPASGFGALALGGGLETEIGTTTLNNASIDGNSLSADSESGLAAVLGAGLMNEGGGALTLHNSHVIANSGTATGAFGFADGGGIFNSLGPGQLTVINSTLTGNTLNSSPGITPIGGGLFTADVFNPLQSIPATLTHTVIEANNPDQCVGC
jgi:hypothetical protein